MFNQIARIRKIFSLVAIFWTLIIAIFILNCFAYVEDKAHQSALDAVKVGLNKDLAYRQWIASHGGVYVPITDSTPPNPYLEHIVRRDVVTRDGQKLTLMNPAYSLTQIMDQQFSLYGTKAKITSNQLLNPDNAPDEWEQKALDIIEKTRSDYTELVPMGDHQILRVLSPMVTQQGCLQCHGHQGYQVGDIRGGISAAVDLQPYYLSGRAHVLSLIPYVILIWVSGLVILFGSYKKIGKIIAEKIRDYEQHIFSLVDVIESRDQYTAGHTRRVAEYASLIAADLGVSREETELLYRAAMVHDVGKVSTPDSILLKPGRLNDLETGIIKKHVEKSFELLSNVKSFTPIAEIVRHHHERHDGQGYPQGLTGQDIPLLSQILSVADAFDAMTTDRIYKPRKTVAEALNEMKSLADKQFSVKVVRSALRVLRDIHIDYTSQLPEDDIEKERFSFFYKDQLTGAYNHNYLNFLLISEAGAQRTAHVCLNLVSLKNFSSINDRLGWRAGDELLKNTVELLKSLFKDGLVFRIYGDDFIMLFEQHVEIDTAMTRVSDYLHQHGVDVSFYHVNLAEKNINDVEELHQLLDSIIFN